MIAQGRKRGQGMTKEQAIDLLDNLIGFVEDSHGSDYDEALKMAIKALIEVDLVKMQCIDKINSIYGMYAQNLMKEGKTDGTL